MMNDKDYIKYLAMKLLYSGEDCCSICAYSPAHDLCENQQAHRDDKPDDAICIEGLRAYADSHKEA